MEKTYKIEGMKCAGCAQTITMDFEAVPGVTSAKVNLDTKTAVVEGDFSEQALLDSLRGTPYKATPEA